MENLNSTPKGERVYIGIFGRRNAGKSSVINAITGQNLAIVSDVLGTTTDPVEKAMELLPIGPVVVIDTPGVDDEGELGAMRVEKTRAVLNKTDIALIVAEDGVALEEPELELKKILEQREIPYIIAYNKTDLKQGSNYKPNEIAVSAKTGEGILELKELLARTLPQEKPQRPLVSDLVDSGDTVILVVPIDSAAPKGRLILPQQQVIRDLLDNGVIAMVCRDTELADTLDSLKNPPKLVITDSQAFAVVSKIVPENIMLTSFSILFARYKGDLRRLLESVRTVESLADGDRILIAEGCTHHRQCDDIGTVKIPRWLREYTGKELEFDFSSGKELSGELLDYKMIIHCGGCMLNEREMKNRINSAVSKNVPIVNYGILIAYLNGILKRSTQPFADICDIIG